MIGKAIIWGNHIEIRIAEREVKNKYQYVLNLLHLPIPTKV